LAALAQPKVKAVVKVKFQIALRVVFKDTKGMKAGYINLSMSLEQLANSCCGEFGATLHRTWAASDTPR
jgi:hypothetical protein